MAELQAAALRGVSRDGDAEDDDNGNSNKSNSNNSNNNNNNDAPALASPPPPIAQQEDGIAPPPPPLPFAAVLRPLLEQKTLSAVDVCELGCVNRELSRCVREFWQAGADPGSQRRLLLVADGAEAESDGRAEGGVVGASPGWPRDEHPTRERAQMFTPCSHCGATYWETRERDDYTYSYPFDDAESRGRGKEGEPLALCRRCYRDVVHDRAPPHSRAAHYRLEGWGRLVKLYGCDLPRSILRDAVPSVRPLRPSTSPVFEHSTPHACVRRAANYALLFTTPRELQARWREMRGGG